MTDNKEGPYKAEIWEANEFVVTGPGWDATSRTYRKNEAEEIARYANSAYAAGVKAERERITQKIIDMQFAFPGFANKTVDRIVESIR